MTIHGATARRFGALALACSMTAAVALVSGGAANAAIVPTVPLGTTNQYSVLAGSTVTNTNTNTVLNQSLGLSPGTSVTNFPPGIVNLPGVQNITNAAAAQAKLDLTAAYNNAAGRPVDFTVPTELGNRTLGAGVYVSDLGPLGITGPLVLDGAGNRNSVFIFKASSSTLTTASASTVSLINGAQECNVFWQIGSSATLGSDSTFRGNILADQSITVTTNVTVHGRALARIGAVTLDDDVFNAPTCDLTGPVPGFPTPTPTTTPGTPGSGGTPGATPTADSGGGTGTGTGTTGGGTATGLTNGAPPVSGPPRTGGAPLSSGGFPWLAIVFVTVVAGAATTDGLVKRRANLRHGTAGGTAPGSEV